MKVDVFDISAKKVGTMELSDAVFAQEYNEPLVHQVVVAQSSPQWTGGGVVFAPKQRDFSQKINKKMKRAATVSALSAKVADNDFIVLKELELKEGKTRLMAAILKSFNIDTKVLLVVSGNDENVLRASANIENLTVISADLVNVYDLAANAKCIATKEAVEAIEKAYGDNEEVNE